MNTLPEEIILKIMDHSKVDYRILREVNKQWNKLSNELTNNRFIS